MVLLTNRKNALNWFSASDESNNIFVHAADWELYTKVNPKYAIAYQVLENVLQVLMKADIYHAPNEFIHEIPRGCMNDLCKRKQEIIIKLQTGNICADCIARIRSEGASEAIFLALFAMNLFFRHRTNPWQRFPWSSTIRAASCCQINSLKYDCLFSIRLYIYSY